MGRRGRKAVFSNVYVFLKLDACDKLPNPASNLRQSLSERISTDIGKSSSFAMAAVRETFEETGLFLAHLGTLEKLIMKAGTKCELWDLLQIWLN